MKWFPIVAGLLAIPATADTYRLNIDGIRQRHSKLCWAAVSAMASRASLQSPVACQFRKPTQEDVVFSENIKTHQLPRRCPARASCPASADLCEPVDDPLDAGKADCSADASKCNSKGSVWLLGLRSRKVGEFGLNNSRYLSAARIKHEIKDREAPVLISWYYVDPNTLNQGQEPDATTQDRAGGHFLIITGFRNNNGKQQVRVWDPWPDQSVDELPEGHVRHKWIPYERYREPKIDNGALVDADHDSDEFALCRCDESDLETVASLTQAQAIQVAQPVQITAPGNFDFSQGVPDLLEARDQVMRVRVVRDAGGGKVRGNLTTEAGIATVVITTKKLLRTSERPEILVVPQTAALVVPVMRNRELVDSFLLVRSGQDWQEDGYSNNEIARRLIEFRAARSSEGRFYLLAIPEQGKFYIGRGFAAAAELVPLNGDVGAHFEPASGVLKRLVEEIKHDQDVSR